jgi:hypothetical protein
MVKAWNKETRLLMRLDSISCVKGELVKKGHILLQYTGLLDKQFDELYEMDVVLSQSSKFVVRWSPEKSAWSFVPFNKTEPVEVLTPDIARSMIRLCSYFESSADG